MRYKYALILFVILISSIFSVAQAAPAQPTNTQDDWVRSVITAEASSAIPAPCSDEADAVKVRFENSGETERVGGCILKGGDFDFITSDSYQSGDEPFYQVLYARDNLAENPVFAQLNDTGSVRKFLYSARSGQLIEIINEPNYARSLLIYKDIRETLQAVRHSRDGKIMEYTVNQNSLGVIKHGYNFSLNNPAITRNGKYIVLGYSNPNSGTIEKIDTTTGLMQSFGTPLNMDINLKVLGVSDSGRYVLVKNTHTVYVYDTQTCNAFDDDGQTVCESRDLGTLVSEPQGVDPSKVYLGRFIANDTGIEIGLMVFGQSEWVKLSIDGSALDYLALGDSFSSGEGDIERDAKTELKAYREHTDDDGTLNVDGSTEQISPKEKCHLSTNSYPYLLANGMELGPPTTDVSITKWQSVACSGATSWDIKEQGSTDYKGQNDDTNNPRLEGYDFATLKNQALNEYIPGRQKQIEFVKKYKPKVITLTMGGNDINFGGKMYQCVTDIATCNDASPDGRVKLKNEIHQQYGNLNSLYEELRDATNGKSKVYVVGYPVYINADPKAKCSPRLLFLNLEEREMIVNSIIYLNNIIEAAAKNAGITYIDIENAFEDHRLCDDGESHVNAVTGVLGYGGNETQESFHPNRKGHEDMAIAIWADVGGDSLIDHQTCPDTLKNTCPDESFDASNATMPPYFLLNNDIDDSTTIRYYTLTDGTLMKSVKHYDVETGETKLEPNSKVDINLYSTPTYLGKFTVSGNGTLSANITIPASVPAGYHKLSVTGTSIEGNPVEIYQTVLVQGLDDDDMDEDGVPDLHDKCIYGLPIDDNVDVSADVGCVAQNTDVPPKRQKGANNLRQAKLPDFVLDSHKTIVFGEGGSAHENKQDATSTSRSNIKAPTTKSKEIMRPYFIISSIALVILLILLYAKNRKQ